MKYRLAITLLLTALLAACGQSPGGDSGSARPEARVTATPETGQAPLTVQFSAAGSRSATGVITAYLWDFGDGETGAGLETSHTYTTPGTYTVRLTVTTDTNATATATKQISVTAGTDPDPGSDTDTNPGPGPQPDPDPEPGPAAPDAQGALASLTVTAGSNDLRTGASELLGDTVVAATQLAGGGGLVVTGTLTQQNNSYSYSAQPADRLVLQLQNGDSFTFQVTQLDGDFDADSMAEFLRKPHVLQFTVNRSAGGVTDQLSIASQRNASQFAAAMRGEAVLQGVRYQIDLMSQGTYKNIVDNYIDYESEETVTGTIASDGLAVNVNEYFRYRYYMFENAIETTERKVANQWSVAGQQYAAVDVHIRRNFFNSKPSEFEYWRAQGAIVRDGVAVGTIGSEVDELSVDIFLLWDGERHLLHRDLR